MEQLKRYSLLNCCQTYTFDMITFFLYSKTSEYNQAANNGTKASKNETCNCTKHKYCKLLNKLKQSNCNCNNKDRERTFTVRQEPVCDCLHVKETTNKY